MRAPCLPAEGVANVQAAHGVGVGSTAPVRLSGGNGGGAAAIAALANRPAQHLACD